MYKINTYLSIWVSGMQQVVHVVSRTSTYHASERLRSAGGGGGGATKPEPNSMYLFRQ